MTKTDTSKCEKCGASLSSPLTARNLKDYPTCPDCGAVTSIRKDTSIRRLAEALQKQLNASVGCFDVKCEGCQREISLIESALTTLAQQIREEDARIAEQELNYWLIDGHAAAKRIAAAIRARQEKS